MESKPMCLWCKKTIYVGFEGYCLDCQNQLDKNNINMNELPQEDLNLIANMDERLKKLETLLDEALAKETPESLTQWLLSKRSIAPVDTKEEVKYKIMLSDCGLNTTKGRIYECYYQKGEDAFTIIDDLGNRNRGWDVGCFSHELFTKEDYLSQQEQPKSIVKEEVKERFSVEVYQPTLTGDEGFKIHISPTFKMRKPMADEIADKIKALLATL